MLLFCLAALYDLHAFTCGISFALQYPRRYNYTRAKCAASYSETLQMSEVKVE